MTARLLPDVRQTVVMRYMHNQRKREGGGETGRPRNTEGDKEKERDRGTRDRYGEKLRDRHAERE